MSGHKSAGGDTLVGWIVSILGEALNQAEHRASDNRGCARVRVAVGEWRERREGM